MSSLFFAPGALPDKIVHTSKQPTCLFFLGKLSTMVGDQLLKYVCVKLFTTLNVHEHFVGTEQLIVVDIFCALFSRFFFL